LNFQYFQYVAWQQDPDDRPDIITFFNMLHALYSNYYMGESNSLQIKASSMVSRDGKVPKRDVLCANSNVIIKTNNHPIILRNGISLQENNSPTNSVSSSSSSSSSNLNNNHLVPVIPLSDGINAHKKGDKEKAWECFETNAKLGNISAIYWQGYYLWEGYHIPADHTRAVNCYKEAAKNGHADAQLRYAFSAINREKINIKGFLKFLKMSANEGNALALFNLGEVYLNGKFGVEKDENLGIKYLKVAAVLKQSKAIEMLKSLNITDTFYL
jgi:TPR repeat protein